MTWPHRPEARGGERGEGPGAHPRRRRSGLAGLLVGALLLPACAGGSPAPGALDPGHRPGAEPGRFALERDAFAFPNLVRALNPDRPVEFANYCIIMVRAAGQFFRFARFAPDLPPVSDAEYERLTRAVLDLTAWAPPRPAERRIVVPGYPDLRAFSRDREPAIKRAFGTQWSSMVHFRNWRVMLAQSRGHQSRLARDLVEEIDGGRPAPLMITTFPEPDYLNHAVLVYGYHRSGSALEFRAYDPNDPGSALGVHFDPASGAFWVGPLPYGPPGRIRAFRIFTSPLL
jgi:hypothetical protein